MFLRVKKIAITTGGPLIALLHEDDARMLDIHHEDRVTVHHNSHQHVCIVDITTSSVPRGCIGLFEELYEKLKCTRTSKVIIRHQPKPESIDFIKKKLNGEKLSASEIYQIVEDITKNKLSDIELTYFVSACYTSVLSKEETLLLTKAMVASGDILHLSQRVILDKHCIGGVAGNRTTMLIVPIVTAAGLTCPKTSSRAITSPAGTADTMEVLANVSIPLKRMKKIVNQVGGCIVWGGAFNLAPADDRIIRVERPLRLDAESQLLASIMAKKLSVSSTHILIDIPIGKGAKLETKSQALHLEKQFLTLGKALRRDVRVLITNGEQPIGNGVGPALEARDVLWILEDDPRGPSDLRQKALHMAGAMLEMGRKAKKGKGYSLAVKILESGKALAKMREIIIAQGKHILESDEIKIGKHRYGVIAEKNGKILHINNTRISHISRVAGAPQDNGAGIYLHKKLGERVYRGEILYTVYSENKEKLMYAQQSIARDCGYEL